jgi:putative DNA primase/helicase
MSLIKKIFPVESVLTFVLKLLSSCLDGYIRDEKFAILSGKHAAGGNGKTTITELTSTALGDYSYSPPVTLVTAKRESPNSANSALYGIRNKRFILMQEPDSNEQLQASTIKGLTGGDKVSCRELNNTQVTFIPMGKFFICTNSIPPIEIDGGISRRLLILEFVSHFVDNPSGKYEYEYKKDTDLKNKLKEYAPVFMCILLKYYKLYRKEGLSPPDSVLQATKKYENDNNMIRQFIEENVIVGDKSMSILKNDLKDIFLKDSILKLTFRKFSTFIKQIENSLCTEFKPDKKNASIHKLHGYRLKSEQDFLDNETEYIQDC